MPNRTFFHRRSKIWRDPKAHRWIKRGGNKNKNIPRYIYWRGEKLTYLQARQKIYCPIYASLVIKTQAYRHLKSMIDMGHNLLLIGYDGYDRGDRTHMQCFLDTSRPYGHEMVLAAMLDPERKEPLPWNDPAVVL